MVYFLLKKISLQSLHIMANKYYLQQLVQWFWNCCIYAFKLDINPNNIYIWYRTHSLPQIFRVFQLFCVVFFS
jgi:hypothetical protein